ncbi:unnamed protein product [Dovyalis caffra]|uniref:Uncharacterized protein n=1 Tax=Dovyalis caffra TaxID=77055 RepID=A0AAV1SG74_9ROSI|nr:unnamed protein product [Dovyalis caffra]
MEGTKFNRNNKFMFEKEEEASLSGLGKLRATAVSMRVHGEVAPEFGMGTIAR